ncbi:MAG: RNA polymerase sigma factor [Chloroflexota bacterium]
MNDPLSLLASAPVATMAADEVQTDQQLAERACNDATAFAELYQRHLPRIYRYHLARCGDVQDAQDLTAQTFLTAFEQIGTFRGRSSFLGWLFGIASHKVADHFRRRKGHVPLEEALEVPHPDPLPEERVSLNLQLAQIGRAIRHISPDRAEALGLRLVAGLSAAEAGRVMGKSEAAVKMLVHRGLQELQKMLHVQ